MPVVSNGVTYYEDVTLTLTFEVGSGGVVTATATPTVVKSPTLTTASFKAGNYLAPSSVVTNGGITVSGPGVRSGGNTEWSLAVTSGSSNYTYPNTAIWYVGSTLSSSPIYPRLEAAKITSTSWSYGVGDYWYNFRESNNLLGFTQSGNTIVIANFTDVSGVDHSVPQDTITYTLAAKQ